MKKISKKKKLAIIKVVLLIVLLAVVLFALIVWRSDYSFKLKFNNEQLNFFNGETLYYNENVNIAFSGNGYTTKIGNSKFSKSTTLKKDGTYKLNIHKFFKSYSVVIKVEKNPSLYLVNKDGEVIHNYLSNSQPFKIVKGSDAANVYINNMTYTPDTLIEDSDNYLVSTDEDAYTVNILSVKN